MLHSIKVDAGEQKYYRYLAGMNLWEHFLDFSSSRFSDQRIFVAIDARVRSLHGKEVVKQCRRYFKKCSILEIPEGEASKSLKHWHHLLDQLLAQGVERGTPLLAVGGGVTGDLAGFTAASALRGIPLVHMPTSLLAMVDSSIGGKTGINHAKGKNLIGAFYQPEAVFADLAFLDTLKPREWAGGLAEMLKYAAIDSPRMFAELERAVNEGFSPSGRWLNLIHQSAKIKVEIVQQDVHEAGVRAYLNFGHTFGHALEKERGYGNISHGEAVFTGMLAASHFSARLGAPVDTAPFEAFLPLYRIEAGSNEKITHLVKAMKNDKKVKDEILHLILLSKWGTPYIKECKDIDLLQEAWAYAFDVLNRNF